MVRIALRGVARNDKDLPASMVYTEILKQRLRSRLSADKTADAFVHNEAYALPGVIAIGYTLRSSDGKPDPTATISKALSDPVTEAEFSVARSAFVDTWSKRDRVTFWLDADTYKIASPETDARIAEGVSLANVSAYAERVRKMPIATVLLNSPGPTS
jgi:hypothetical protein